LKILQIIIQAMKFTSKYLNSFETLYSLKTFLIQADSKGVKEVFDLPFTKKIFSKLRFKSHTLSSMSCIDLKQCEDLPKRIQISMTPQ